MKNAPHLFGSKTKKWNRKTNSKLSTRQHSYTLLSITDSKYRESLDRFEKSKTLKLCLKNAFRELSSKMSFRFSKNSTPSRNSQKTKIHLFTSVNMQKLSGKLTKFSVIHPSIHLQRLFSAYAGMISAALSNVVYRTCKQWKAS